MNDDEFKSRLLRTRAILDTGEKMGLRNAPAYATLVMDGPNGVISSACAMILELPFDVINPRYSIEPRKGPALLLATRAVDLANDEIHALARGIVQNAPGSLIVLPVCSFEASDTIMSAFEEHHIHVRQSLH